MEIINIILFVIQLIVTGVAIFLFLKYNKEKEAKKSENIIKDGDIVQFYTQYYTSAKSNVALQNLTLASLDSDLEVILLQDDKDSNIENTYFQINFSNPSLTNKSVISLKHVKSGRYVLANCYYKTVTLGSEKLQECSESSTDCGRFQISFNNPDAKNEEVITSSSVITLLVSSNNINCRNNSSTGSIVTANDKNEIVLKDVSCLQDNSCGDNQSLVWLIQKLKKTSTPSSTSSS